MKRITRLILQMLPGILGGLAVVCLFVAGIEIQPEDISRYAPRQPLLAALAMLGLYGVKSISVFLPMLPLQLAVGFMFHRPLAVAVNSLGFALGAAISYLRGRSAGTEAIDQLMERYPRLPLQLAVGFMFHRPLAVAVNSLGFALGAAISYLRGRSAGTEAIDQLMERYPRLRGFVRGSKDSNLFLSFILRVIGMVPLDISSMYLGSTGMPFFPYLLATMTGALPKIVAITLVGDSITEPGSPAFLLSAAFTAGLTLLSSLFYLWYRKRHQD